jgi:hypothetical protein
VADDNDFPPGIERATDEQAKAARHDVPGEPSQAQKDEHARQLEDEKLHGHPALKENP